VITAQRAITSGQFTPRAFILALEMSQQHDSSCSSRSPPHSPDCSSNSTLCVGRMTLITLRERVPTSLSACHVRRLSSDSAWLRTTNLYAPRVQQGYRGPYRSVAIDDLVLVDCTLERLWSSVLRNALSLIGRDEPIDPFDPSRLVLLPALWLGNTNTNRSFLGNGVVPTRTKLIRRSALLKAYA
jgi:hypothetical protein